MDTGIRQLSKEEKDAAIKADAYAAADKQLLADANPYSDGCSKDHSDWLDHYHHRVMWLSGELSA